jgi:hypothetical protein
MTGSFRPASTRRSPPFPSVTFRFAPLGRLQQTGNVAIAPPDIARTRRLFLLSLAAFGILLLGYGLKRLTLGIDFTDEGAHLAWPLPMLFGDQSFANERDTMFRPLSAYIYVVFKLHPSMTLYEFRMLGWAIHLLSFGVLSTYLFRLTRAPLQSPLVASLPFFVCNIFGLASPSYYSLSSDFLLLALCLRGLGSAGETRWATLLQIASGLALFGATLAHAGLGLVAAVIVLYEIFGGGLIPNLWRRRLTPSNIGVLVFLACWVAFVAYLACIGAAAVWYQHVTLFRSLNVSSVRTSPFLFYRRLLGVPFVFSPFNLLVTWASVAAAALMAFRSRARPVAAAALALLLLVSFIFGFSYAPQFLPLTLAQAALILVVVHGLGLTAPLLPADGRVRFLLLVSGLGAVTYATLSYFFSPFRSWVSGILALPFAFAVGLALLLAAKPGRHTALFKALATAMLVLAAACVARDHYRTIYRDAPPGDLSAEFRTPKLHHIHSTAERVQAVDALYAYLQPRIRRGEPLLVYDNCPMLFFLFEAKPAYGQIFVSRITQTPASLEQLDREFRAKPLPRYAIRLLVNVSEPVWSTAARFNYDHYPLNDTVLSHYELERTIFPFEIWRLKSPAS